MWGVLKGTHASSCSCWLAKKQLLPCISSG